MNKVAANTTPSVQKYYSYDLLILLMSHANIVVFSCCTSLVMNVNLYSYLLLPGFYWYLYSNIVIYYLCWSICHEKQSQV